MNLSLQYYERVTTDPLNKDQCTCVVQPLLSMKHSIKVFGLHLKYLLMVEMFQLEQWKIHQKLQKRTVYIQAKYALSVAAIAFIITPYNYDVSVGFFSS